MIRKAVLISFSSADYLAVLKLMGSHKEYLEGVAVARNIPADAMQNGRQAAVLYFSACNPKEALVIAVY